MKTSSMSWIGTLASHSSRREFMLRTMSLIAGGSDTGLSAADLQIDTLGEWLREAGPNSATELAREEVAFVDGWLSAQSEAGVALLFTAARAKMQFQAQTGLAV